MALENRRSRTFDPESREPFKVSRSKIDLFLECPRCFYLENRLGVKRPSTYPLTLNIAVDALLKKEFDLHRAKGEPHPAMKAYGVDAIPYRDKNLNTWRELDFGRGGIHVLHSKTGLDVYGIVDDVWINPKGELIVVDYKATAKRDAPTLDGDLGAQYKRQMEVYQWLLRQSGYRVSDTGFFFYVNGKKDLEAFDGKLEFDITILPCTGDTSWIEPTLLDIKKTLDREAIPPVGPKCEYCAYREFAGKAFRAVAVSPEKAKTPATRSTTKKTNENSETKTLF